MLHLILAVLFIWLLIRLAILLFWLCCWHAIQPVRFVLWILCALERAIAGARRSPSPTNVIQFKHRCA